MGKQVYKLSSFSPNKAHRFDDKVGHRYDWVGFCETNAKAHELELLETELGHSVHNVGCATGRDHLPLGKAVSPGG